jgi:hypothetical protein
VVAFKDDKVFKVSRDVLHGIVAVVAVLEVLVRPEAR